MFFQNLKIRTHTKDIASGVVKKTGISEKSVETCFGAPEPGERDQPSYSPGNQGLETLELTVTWPGL